MPAMTTEQAWEKLDEYERDAWNASETDIMNWMLVAGVPADAMPRVQAVWKRTATSQGKLIHVGRIAISLVVRFCNEKQPASGGLALGSLFTLGLQTLAATVTVLADMLTPLVTSLALAGCMGSGMPPAALFAAGKETFGPLSDIFHVLRRELIII